jgi:hypothetical protein
MATTAADPGRAHPHVRQRQITAGTHGGLHISPRPAPYDRRRSACHGHRSRSGRWPRRPDPTSPPGSDRAGRSTRGSPLWPSSRWSMAPVVSPPSVPVEVMRSAPSFNYLNDSLTYPIDKRRSSERVTIRVAGPVEASAARRRTGRECEAERRPGFRRRPGPDRLPCSRIGRGDRGGRRNLGRSPDGCTSATDEERR